MAKTRVFIVEDEIFIARDLQMSLENEGYEVVDIASSGEAAIDKIEKENPDVVLMDIMLKGKMDGIETAAEVNSRFEIPVIFVTAYADDEFLLRAKITEPYGYITKPFEIGDIRIAIEIAMYRHLMEVERKKIVKDLENALAKVDTLTGLLPICSSCKKVRADDGFWTQVEEYIEEHTGAHFTHSMCPECVGKFVAENKKKGDKTK